MKYVNDFLYFWYDFIVGDAWEVAAGVVLALGVAWLLARIQPTLATALGPALAVAVMAVLSGSLWWELRRRQA